MVDIVSLVVGAKTFHNLTFGSGQALYESRVIRPECGQGPAGSYLYSGIGVQGQ